MIYEQMSALFLKTADNEKEHAKMWFKELAGIGDTKENLAAAAEGENYEWTDMYEGFAISFTSAFFITFSKSDAGCLHKGHTKSSGYSSPTYSYPQILQRHIV